MEDRAEDIFAQRVVESYLPKVGDPAYMPEAIKLINHIKNRQYTPDWEEFFQIRELLEKFKTDRAEHDGTR
jgi:hypothetical protein